MFNVQKFTTVLQIVGAALGIPAAAGGTYSVYRSYFAPTANCQTLRTSLLDTIDRGISADSRRALMKKDLAEFSQKCAGSDPDAMAVFTVALRQTEPPPAAAAPAIPATPAVAEATKADSGKPAAVDMVKAEVAKPAAGEAGHPQPGIFSAIPIGGFGKSGSVEAKGLVALDRRDSDHFGESSFDGFETGKEPAEKTILTARWAVPVWPEPQAPGLPDVSRVQGRLAKGQCLRVLAYRTAAQGRPWAHVELADCATVVSK
jgi:hypothetical protein